MTSKTVSLEQAFEITVSLLKDTQKELELQKSWVKHHQKSVENKLAENERLRNALMEIKKFQEDNMDCNQNDLYRLSSIWRLSSNALKETE